MQPHFWEEAVDYTVEVSRGFTALKDSAYTEYLQPHGGQPWRYVLIPHKAITENMILQGLYERSRSSSKNKTHLYLLRTRNNKDESYRAHAQARFLFAR
ncbi:MAG: hypothetical protein HC929_02230 [Leptolyngbyaceae cyanobacterium SM2_5_2]|nr:hypothetical protein [Leptolyngbyaceae cyanobacterium SM2_5_2]